MDYIHGDATVDLTVKAGVQTIGLLRRPRIKLAVALYVKLLFPKSLSNSVLFFQLVRPLLILPNSPAKILATISTDHSPPTEISTDHCHYSRRHRPLSPTNTHHTMTIIIATSFNATTDRCNLWNPWSAINSAPTKCIAIFSETARLAGKIASSGP